MHPSMWGVIVNKVILVEGLLAFLLIASTDASACVAGPLYFPGDTYNLGDGKQINIFLAKQSLMILDWL